MLGSREILQNSVYTLVCGFYLRMGVLWWCVSHLSLSWWSIFLLRDYGSMHACSYFFLVFYEMAFLSIQGLQMGGVERELTRARGAAPGFKVAVLGAAGGIGQPLSLLLKMNPLVSTLHLYDVFNTPGVTADLSHTNTSAVVCDSFLFPVVFFTIWCKLLPCTRISLVSLCFDELVNFVNWHIWFVG